MIGLFVTNVVFSVEVEDLDWGVRGAHLDYPKLT